MSTTDTERYVRLTLLTFEGGLWIARKILMREVDRAGALTLDDLLLGKNTLLKTRRDITKRQYETLFPTSGNDTNIDEWDLSLLIRIIKILFGLVLSGQDRYSLDELLRIRNDIVCHASQPSLSEQDFYTHRGQLTMCIGSLAANFDVATTQYAADLTQRLSRGPLDLQSSIEQIAKLCRNDEHIENVLESLARQERKLNEVASGVALSNQKIDDVLAVVREIKRTQSERGEDVCRVEIPLLNTTVCISGKKDDVVKLAQDILLKVHKTAIDKVENPDDEATVRDAVQQFLADIENKGAVVVSAENGSIILKIRCNDLVGLENMLSLFRDNENRCRLFGIENALNAVLLDAMKVELVLPDNTIAMLREWIENDAHVNKRYLKLGIQCDSVEAAAEVMKYLEGDESANRLNQIAEATSRVVGEKVKVDAVPDVKRFSQGLANDPHVTKIFLKPGIQCDSVEAVAEVMKYLEGDGSANRLNKISEAMSRVVGEKVKVDAVPDEERFSQGLVTDAAPRGIMDNQSSDSYSIGATEISSRPGLAGLPKPAEQDARYRPTLANYHSRPAMKTRAEHVGDIAVMDEIEINMDHNDITGSVVMPGEKLVTVNASSSKVQLIDLKTDTVVAQLLLPGTLCDITQISDTQVAVTADITQEIFFVNVSDKLKIDHSVQVNGKCTGITRLHDNLLVSYDYSAKVEILNMKGQLVQTVVTETQGELLFERPRYVVVSPDQSTIYISDWYRHTVTRLSLAGEVLAMYIPQDKASLDEPRGLVVDKSGSVYVCGGDSNNVLQLAADLTQPRQLLQESDGVKWPRSVSYCQTTDRLYIGMLQSRVMKVYQLK